MNERRIQPGETDYNPITGFMTLKEIEKIEKIEKIAGPPPENPREGQLWLIPSESTTIFRSEPARHEIKREIDELVGRSDTIVSPRRFSILQFTNGRWESLVY